VGDASPVETLVTLYPVYPVRIDKRMQVYSLDGKPVGGPELALAIIAGFNSAAPEVRNVEPEISAAEVAKMCRRGKGRKTG